MGDERSTHSTPRAAPVAGLPIDALLERTEDVARRWAISLVLLRPLDGLGDVPLEELAHEAPALCEQAFRSLESDAELDRLTGTGTAAGRADAAPARRLAAIAGAPDAADTVEAAEALRGALWETLLEELRWPTFEQSHARRVADVSDRLAYVCARTLAAALTTPPVSAGGPEEPRTPGAQATAPAAARAEREVPPTRRAVIVDERDDMPSPPPRRPEQRVDMPSPPPRPVDQRAETHSPPPRPVEEREHGPSRPPRGGAEIEIRDERGEVGPAAWIGSIGRQLERFTRDDVPFAVLLVELRDGERLRRDAPPEDVSRLADQLEHALASELRRSVAARPSPGGGDGAPPASGSLTRERAGRYWLLAPSTDRAGARILAGRLIEAARRLAGDRGSLLELAVGTAVCPEDGREAATLAAHADVELYAARSSTGRPPASVD
jgi:GGDEF domain-containing protein